MPSTDVHTFTDPDAFRAAIRGNDVEGVVTASGNFHAELTRVDFHRLWTQRGDESLPRVLNIPPPMPFERVVILFTTKQGYPETHVSGMAPASSDIIVWNAASAPIHHRSVAACGWGAASLTREDIATFGEAILGRELAPPTFLHCIRPPAPVLSRLSNLHSAAGHLAQAAPTSSPSPR